MNHEYLIKLKRKTLFIILFTYLHITVLNTQLGSFGYFKLNYKLDLYF
jgi:hypothetical protein